MSEHRSLRGARPVRRLRQRRRCSTASRSAMGVEAVAIIGRNGMGKTTLCNTIMGLVPATSRRGRPSTASASTTSYRRRSPRRGIAYVPQGRRLFPSLTVDEHLTMLAKGTRGKRWTPDAVYELFPRLAERRRNGGGRAVGRRAADARGRPGAAAQRLAGDHGRAVRGARSHHRRHADRGRAPPRRRRGRRARRRAEPPRRDAHGRSAAGDGVGPDPGRDHRRRADRQTRSCNALPRRRSAPRTRRQRRCR